MERIRMINKLKMHGFVRPLILALALCSYGPLTAAANLNVFVQNSDIGQGLEDAVVEVLLPVDLQSSFMSAIQTTVDQQNKEFVDAVTVIPQGSHVSFPNSDNILHHVYSFSEAKVFELPLYGSGELSDYRQLFDIPGVVELGCNIHDWMLGYIYVAQTALVAKTDQEGRASIRDIPDGVYTVRVWHPQSPEDGGVIEQQVEFTGEETAIVRLAIEPIRSSRLRRAPNTSRTRYR